MKNLYLKQVLKEFKEEKILKSLIEEAREYAKSRLHLRITEMGPLDEGFMGLMMRSYVDGRLRIRARP